MTDPAIEAARKAVNGGLGFPNGPVDAFAVQAAREALEPIRDRHRPFDRPVGFMSKETERVCTYCMGPKKWPCLDALDAYSTEELEKL